MTRSSALAPLATPTMRRALSDPALLGNVLPGVSWQAWRVLLVALMGEPLDDDERAIFARLTGRATEPLERVEEFWALAGRRAGKSRAVAVLIVFLACLVDYRSVIAIGERPVVLCLAATTKQAGIVFAYVAAIIDKTPLLAKLIKAKLAEALSLRNGIDIEVRAASFRGLRGITAVAIVTDEICYWFSDESGSANPDTAILDAVRPSLATTGGPLIAISSPYGQRGEAYQTWARHFGAKGDPLVLVVQGASRDFNPSLPQKVVDRAMERDPAAARAEYLGQFRNDVAAYLDRALIEAAVDAGVKVRAPKPGVTYFGAVDAASGSGKDSFTGAICHLEAETVVLDMSYEILPPFRPQEAVEALCDLFRSARIYTVVGDRWSQGFTVDSFSKCGIAYQYCELDRSEVYLEVLGLFTSGRVRLIDNNRLVAQFAGLERRTSPGGRDRVDHGREGHDDVSNSAAIALWLAAKSAGFDMPGWARVIAGPDEEASRDVPAALPWHPSKQTRERRDAAANPNGEGGALHDIYLETRHRYDQTGGFGKRSAENTCERCKQPIISGETRVTDGISAFHARCSPWPAR